MSPAVIAEMQPDHHDQLEAVGKAFDALLLTVYQLTHRQNELLQHMDNVFKEYTNVIEILPPQDRHHAQDVQFKLFAQQEEYRQGLVHSKPRVEEQPLNSMDVIKTLVSHQNVDENTLSAIKNGVKGCKHLLRSQDSPSQISSNSCILAQAPAPVIALEKDFTTNGTQGNLHCPFSKPNKMQSTNGSEAPSGRNSAPKIQIEATCGHEHLDPIKAEQDERRSSHTPSAPSSKGACPVSRCPIRFLDQHSPEEIAEYVERHKHEIPRSHAICVNRYQRNPRDMRQLDAKYGGLTSMIAGLGVKHQAFLPDRQTNGEGHSSHSVSTERVEKWADNVDPNTPSAEIEKENENEEDNEDDNRQSHFDRPLREVRVGESPSRPWGISVPVTHLPLASAPLSGSASIPTIFSDPQTDKPNKAANTNFLDDKPAHGCPFGHGKPKPEVPKPETETTGGGESPKDKNVITQEKPGCPFGYSKSKAEVSKPETEPPWTGDWPKTWPKDQDVIAKAPAPAPQVASHAPTAPVSKDSTTKPGIPSIFSTPSHITFNGPLFFGYSAEETANLLQQFGNLGKS
ncbi:uncharacterized protein N7479_010168 [Penicillium vulpinum]|uniref:Uncharacterized protein n=1 Tax=Penicillium vulpinum TaxID=29845 RepID=A0A1V6RW42_9EURO|nr:uncharacterized protein N7479_010168 [Penicillium vulpinum]KAJ5951755.1 hypothetical protein N7479_010168 [Penicillium vulpinum]OQE05623.1 hypothetical protein PENVUL_c023G01634 [Penicillium vulpinum]